MNKIEDDRIEITQLEHVQLLVDTFYGHVQKDELIGPIFNKVIQDKWPVHLEKMYRFWQTVLLKEHTYHGTPFLPHIDLPIHPPHFERWLAIFDRTVDENFVGEVADEAKWRAKKMADMFMHKLEFYRNNRAKPLM